MMQIIVNGDVRDVEDTPTIGALLASRRLNVKVVVVERNGEIVPRGLYDEATLAAGDVLEIVQMMAGG